MNIVEFTYNLYYIDFKGCNHPTTHMLKINLERNGRNRTVQTLNWKKRTKD